VSIVIAVAFEGGRIDHWMRLLSGGLPSGFVLTPCSSAAALRDADPEIVVGQQEGFLLDFLERPSGRLKWVHVLSAGIDRSVARLGSAPPFRMTRTSIHAAAMREYVLATMLAFTKRLGHWQREQAARRWQPDVLDLIEGKHLVVVGTGAIGSGVAEAARALGLRVTGVSRSGASRPAFETVVETARWLDVLPVADFLVLAAPLTPATRQLVDRRALSILKPGAILINIARGALVDEAALLERLNDGHLAGAALDAFETEPLPPDSPLWSARNVVITPHVSGRFDGGHERGRAQLFANLHAYANGEPLSFEVDFTRGY
jgi:phosphoglycerate dehydrogenase-like enzyme